MSPEQKADLLDYLERFLDGDEVDGPDESTAHKKAEDLLLEALGDEEVAAKWREARNSWWYA